MPPRPINNFNFKRQLSFSNLTREEWSALRSLRTRRDIVIKPADKGGAVVVWRSDLYKEEAFRQLSDTNFYAKVDKDLTPSHQKLVKELSTSLSQTAIFHLQLKTFLSLLLEPPHIYFLPKINKPNNPGRPIVSACKCPTKLISSYLAAVMLGYASC